MQLPRKEAIELRSANPQLYDLVTKQLADKIYLAIERGNIVLLIREMREIAVFLNPDEDFRKANEL
jgi:hypothetical protein